MTSWFVNNPRLLLMSIILIVVAGVVSFAALPRMEDPVLTARFALVTSVFPGATPERVEALVAKNIEQQLADIKEIHELTSISRSGVSVVVIELNDDLSKDQVPTIWGVVRERLTAAHALMPSSVVKPKLKELDAKAHAMLLAVRWNLPEPPSHSILRRLAKRLQERVEQIEGTEKTELFGDPGEEIVVEIPREQANSLGLEAAEVAEIITGNDTKLPAGRLQSNSSGLTLEVMGGLETQTRLGRIPIRRDQKGAIVELADIATISRGTPDPAPALAFCSGRPAVVVGVHVRDSYRIDVWRTQAEEVLTRFQHDLPAGIELQVMFDQHPYVEQRFESLLNNFVTGLAAVIICTAIWMDLRSALVVGLMLPLNCLLVLPILMVFEIPLHQMSVSGLVIAMGLLVDNAIVVVDHIGHQVSHGKAVRQAAIDSSRLLIVPLLGATLTTVFSFAPIALMPGATGEFVGAIAQVTIITVLLSYALALSVIPGLSWLLFKSQRRPTNPLTNPWGISTSIYRRSLRVLLRFPVVGAALTAVVSMVGFVEGVQLESQFFPPADRDQFYIELDLAPNATLQETIEIATQIREHALLDEAIQEVHWFVGESAPVFYYNVATVRSNQPSYGQAIVQCTSASVARQAMLRLQADVSRRFPEASIAVRQLEQGPPFTAPIEVRLSGPDLERLHELAAKVRLVLSQTPGVTHTRCEAIELSTKGEIKVDQTASYLAGYPLTSIAATLNGSLDGVVGGTVLEGTEEIPVRTRIARDQRGDLNQILSLDLQPRALMEAQHQSGTPMSAITSIDLSADVGAMVRVNRGRCADVLGYLPAAVLPATVQQDFQVRLAESDFDLPSGYRLQFLGAAGEQDQALGNLGVYAAIMGTSLVATLVLSLNSFRLALLVGLVCGLSVGFSLLALAWFQFPFGFMAIIGIVGMLGVAVNDSILVLTALSLDPGARQGDPTRIIEIAVDNARHMLVTSLTTIAGFLPLIWSGGDFWPPTAICVSMGVLGSTWLALFFIPCCYLLFVRLPRAHALETAIGKS